MITMNIDPRIDNRVVTCGGNPHTLATPTTKGVITDAVCSSARVNRTPAHIGRTGRDKTTPSNCNFAVRSPWDNGLVLIGGIIVFSTMGHSGNLDILNKRQSTYPSVSSNTHTFDASVDGILADDRYYTSIFRKVLGRVLSDSLSADIYLRCRMYFTSNAVGTEAPNFAHLELLAVNASDKFNTFGTHATSVRRPTDGTHWYAPGNVFGEVTAVGISGTSSEQKYS